jgi:hypothetical protein
MPFGPPGQEKLNMNIDSLWTGGPFESSVRIIFKVADRGLTELYRLILVATQRVGDPNSSTPFEMAFSVVEQEVSLKFHNFKLQADDVSDVSELLGTNNHYGSYRVLANVTVQIEGINAYVNYNRSLDLTTGIHTTTFLASDMNKYTTVTYCSNPAKVCIYRVSSTAKLPNVVVSVENRLGPANLYTLSCKQNQVRMNGITQDGDPKGMEYDLMVRLSTGPLGMPMSSCATNHNGTLVVTGSAYGKDLVLNSFSIVIGAMTDYDATKGNPENKFSFRGAKPGPLLEKTTASASTKIESKLAVAHTQDYQRWMNEFGIELFDPWKGSKYPSEKLEFTELLDRYKYTAGVTPSGKNHKREIRKELVEKKAGREAKSLNKRVAQFEPKNGPKNEPSSEAAQTWSAVPTAHTTLSHEAPQFPFPTDLAPGVTPTGVIPWHSDGLATATGADNIVYTVTLSKTQRNVMAEETGMPMADQTAPEKLTGFSTENVDWVSEHDELVRTLVEEGSDPTAAQGDPYVEALLFDYARHLFISSSREDSLPPNLQGIWQDSLESAWGGDYHANINLQMNHWFADQTGLGPLQEALWKYIENTWVSRFISLDSLLTITQVPRGKETAKLLYNAPGWVVHDEVNIFGHTGMKNTATWANCRLYLSASFFTNICQIPPPLLG